MHVCYRCAVRAREGACRLASLFEEGHHAECLCHLAAAAAHVCDDVERVGDSQVLLLSCCCRRQCGCSFGYQNQVLAGHLLSAHLVSSTAELRDRYISLRACPGARCMDWLAWFIGSVCCLAWCCNCITCLVAFWEVTASAHAPCPLDFAGSASRCHLAKGRSMAAVILQVLCCQGVVVAVCAGWAFQLRVSAAPSWGSCMLLGYSSD